MCSWQVVACVDAQRGGAMAVSQSTRESGRWIQAKSPSGKDVRRYVPVVSTPFTFGIAAGDINSDDRPDLIVSNDKNHDSVSSLLNTTP